MHFALMLVIAAFRDATTADLLDDLRKNLYQNNEDYIQPPSDPSSTQQPAGPATPPATTQHEASHSLSKYREVKPAKKTEFVFPSIMRRMNDANVTQGETIKPDKAEPNAAPQPGNASLTTTARAQSAASRANELGPPALKPHRLKTRTKDEPKRFENGKEAFEINPVTRPEISKGGAMRAADGERPQYRARRVRARKHRGRGRAGHERREGRVTPARGGDPATPRPDLLDMAPARGPRVHAKRLRNRLCQRSVLKPEGPKYDSKGQIYLQKFTPRGQGNFDFNQTRPPALVLPRCCNCCRKSVLGCE